MLPGRLTSALALLVALAPLPSTATPSSTVQRFDIDAPALHDRAREVRVYLPPSYFEPAFAKARYPVVYLLHGWPGSEGNWFGSGHAAETADAMIAAGQIPEIILVGPNGNGRGFLGRSFYINSYDGSSRMEDFIARDLVRWVDSTFRTIPTAAGRAIVGLSDGAIGAFNLTFRHTDVFGACGGHSGDFRLTAKMGMGGVIGPEPGASRLLAQNSPALYVEQVAPRLRDTVIYFDCGIADDTIEDNRELHRVLERLGIPHTYREFPGSHTWSYWREHLRDSLRAVTARWPRTR